MAPGLGDVGCRAPDGRVLRTGGFPAHVGREAEACLAIGVPDTVGCVVWRLWRPVIPSTVGESIDFVASSVVPVGGLGLVAAVGLEAEAIPAGRDGRDAVVRSLR